MSFLFERISQANVDPVLHLTRGPVYAMQSIWARDTERDMILLDLGGKGRSMPSPGEPPDYYNLIWRGATIAFAGYYQRKHEKHFAEFDYVFEYLAMPKPLFNEVELIKLAIVEALQAYWQGLVRRPVAIEVKAVFPAPQHIEELGI
jgi:hypothetical protein